MTLPLDFLSKHSNHWDYPDEPYISPRDILRANIARVTADYHHAGLQAPRMTDQYQVFDSWMALQTILSERRFA